MENSGRVTSKGWEPTWQDRKSALKGLEFVKIGASHSRDYFFCEPHLNWCASHEETEIQVNKVLPAGISNESVSNFLEFPLPEGDPMRGPDDITKLFLAARSKKIKAIQINWHRLRTTCA